MRAAMNYPRRLRGTCASSTRQMGKRENHRWPVGARAAALRVQEERDRLAEETAALRKEIENLQQEKGKNRRKTARPEARSSYFGRRRTRPLTKSEDKKEISASKEEKGKSLCIHHLTPPPPQTNTNSLCITFWYEAFFSF